MPIANSFKWCIVIDPSILKVGDKARISKQYIQEVNKLMLPFKSSWTNSFVIDRIQMIGSTFCIFYGSTMIMLEKDGTSFNSIKKYIKCCVLERRVK